MAVPKPDSQKGTSRQNQKGPRHPESGQFQISLERGRRNRVSARLSGTNGGVRVLGHVARVPRKKAVPFSGARTPGGLSPPGPRQCAAPLRRLASNSNPVDVRRRPSNGRAFKALMLMDEATVLHACRLLHEALCDDLELGRLTVNVERDCVLLTIHSKRGLHCLHGPNLSALPQIGGYLRDDYA
jgi:hypothetical protein